MANKDIVLALGGGGIKGVAHIGVIRELVRSGYTIRAVSGTSAGGLVGALIAAGYSPDELTEIILGVDQAHLFSRSASDGPSLLGLNGLTQILTDTIGSRTFADLKIPFACTAVDLTSCQEVILTQGAVVDAALATIAVPGIFPPKQIGEAFLVDGGVLDPVPVSVARWLNPHLPIIAVCLSPESSKWVELPTSKVPQVNPYVAPILDYFSRQRIGQAFQIFIKSLDITSRSLAELRLQVDQPDMIIRPNVMDFDMLDKVDPSILMQRGEQAAQAMLPKLDAIFSWQNKLRRRFRKAELPGKIAGS